MTTYLTVFGLIFVVMIGGILVDRLYARFAQRNPELGPFRKNDGGCGCCAAASACAELDNHCGARTGAPQT